MNANTDRIDHITIKGFRSIKGIERLELHPINLLIGANGSGKSNFIGVFAFLHALRQGRLLDYTDRSGGADNILHFGSKETGEMEIEVSFREEVNGYQIKLSPTENDRFYIKEERCWYWDKTRYPERPYDKYPLRMSRHEAGISEDQSDSVTSRVIQRLEGWRIYHFHDTSPSSPMKKTADVDDNRFLRPDGANLAAYLYLLKQKHEASYALIRQAIQLVAPFFDDLQLEPLRKNESKIKLEWRHRSSDKYFDSSSLSDGTLRFICLATLFLQPLEYRPSVILTDEPELGLHPYALTVLAGLIKSIAQETQVILSTQSSFLLDHFEPDDVLVTDLVEGATAVRRLTSEELGNWLEEYSLGQLWEKNHFGGRSHHG